MKQIIYNLKKQINTNYITIIFLFIISFILYGCENYDERILKNGDIIFHESLSSQSKVIKSVTGSKYTHVGIIFIQNNKTYVLEAVQPVRITPINEFIDRGVKKHFVIKRVKSSKAFLTNEMLDKMYGIGKSFPGKDYDIFFKWDDSQIYCSELVWKIYKRGAGLEIGNLEKFKDYDLSSSEAKFLIKQRYGSQFNPEELIITLSHMFESDKLETVYQN